MANLHRRLAGRVLCWLPNRTKRLVLIASLSARIMRCTAHDDARMVELNNQLQLCWDIKAMQLPIYASALIWNSKAIQALAQELNHPGQCEHMRCAMDLEAIVPEWLRYDGTTMASDLARLTHQIHA